MVFWGPFNPAIKVAVLVLQVLLFLDSLGQLFYLVPKWSTKLAISSPFSVLKFGSKARFSTSQFPCSTYATTYPTSCTFCTASSASLFVPECSHFAKADLLGLSLSNQ